METQVTELDGSRVKVDVDLTADEVAERTNRAARSMAREMRLPGFRKGKAPPSLVIQRVGFPAVLEEALRDALPEWYQQAIIESGVVPIGDPEVEVGGVPDGEGEPLSFQFEVGVRPDAVLGEYLGLEVERPEAAVPEDIVDREIDRLREGMARLEPVDRAATKGDHLLVDFTGRLDGEEFEGGSARDQVIELGSGRLIEGFEEQLEGATGGQEVVVEVTFPEDYGAAELAGKDAQFDVSVREVREKILPEADDDFAIQASEFEGMAELREDISARVAEVAEQRIEQDFRLAAVDAAVDNATVELPDALVRARGEERWERFERQIEAQGMNPDSYLQMHGKTREEVIDESLEDAAREISREAVLVAVADAEGLEVDDEELEAELAHMAEHERTTPAKLLERLRRDGRDRLVAADIRVRKAIDLIAEKAVPVPVEVTRDESGQDADGAGPDEPVEGEGKKLWTPGDPK